MKLPRFESRFTRRVALLLFAGQVVGAQNVVVEGGGGRVLPAVEVSTHQVEGLVNRVPDLARTADDSSTRLLSSVLQAQINLLVEGWPWMALHHTLGISGAEVYFDHPDELFLSLAMAIPRLPEPLAEKADHLLAQCLTSAPPYGIEGFDRRAGRARESYDVPPPLRLPGRGRPHGALGIYSFWAYAHYGKHSKLPADHWPAIKSRLQPLLQQPLTSGSRGGEQADDAPERLNADIAGLIGGARLARMVNDVAMRQSILPCLRRFLEARVNLERTNALVILKTNAATKHLHNVKLARYCAMVPELGLFLAEADGGCARERLREIREARPGWYLAYGERLIGGENYTNPLHFRRALASGAALVEQLPGEVLAGFVDRPHGAADLYFIEQLVLTLWSLAGRP